MTRPSFGVASEKRTKVNWLNGRDDFPHDRSDYEAVTAESDGEVQSRCT